MPDSTIKSLEFHEGPTPPTAPNVAALIGKPIDDVLDALCSADSERTMPLVKLLLGRVLALLRTGATDDLFAAAIRLSKAPSSAAPGPLSAAHPGEQGWASLVAGLSELLAYAANQGGPDAAQRVLESKRTHGWPLLSCVQRGGRVQRQQLRAELRIDEAQLSRLLGEFEHAGLVRCIRLPGKKHVVVELGPAGIQVTSAAQENLEWLEPKPPALPVSDEAPSSAPAGGWVSGVADAVQSQQATYEQMLKVAG
jgi:hypothetical protein